MFNEGCRGKFKIANLGVVLEFIVKFLGCKQGTGVSPFYEVLFLHKILRERHMDHIHFIARLVKVCHIFGTNLKTEREQETRGDGVCLCPAPRGHLWRNTHRPPGAHMIFVCFLTIIF